MSFLDSIKKIINPLPELADPEKTAEYIARINSVYNRYDNTNAQLLRQELENIYSILHSNVIDKNTTWRAVRDYWYSAKDWIEAIIYADENGGVIIGPGIPTDEVIIDDNSTAETTPNQPHPSSSIDLLSVGLIIVFLFALYKVAR